MLFQTGGCWVNVTQTSQANASVVQLSSNQADIIVNVNDRGDYSDNTDIVTIMVRVVEP